MYRLRSPLRELLPGRRHRDERCRRAADLAEKCIGCVKCVKVCPAQAIEMFFTPEEQKILDELEQKGQRREEDDDRGSAPGTEARRLPRRLGLYRADRRRAGQGLMGAARQRAGTGRCLDVELAAVVIGDEVEHLCNEAFAYGADKAYLIDAPVFKHYRTEAYLRRCAI